MFRMTENKIIIVIRNTRLDDIITRFNTLEQAKFYIESLGADFSDYVIEDKTYKASVLEVETQLRTLGRVQIIERTFLQNFIFGKNDTVVVIGQDGLVANTLKYLNQHPVVAINPDPKRWDGVLLPFQVANAHAIVKELFMNKRPSKAITFAKVTLNNGQTLYAVNDLFIGPKSHTSAQYILEVGKQKERQSSSGIIISTGLGSTGWLKSIFAGACAITGNQTTQSQDCSFQWDANYLWYSVREPFPSNITGIKLTHGKINDFNNLTITSLMADHGIIFSDGIESDFIEFNSGTKATISIADKKGILIQ